MATTGAWTTAAYERRVLYLNSVEDRETRRPGGRAMADVPATRAYDRDLIIVELALHEWAKAW